MVDLKLLETLKEMLVNAKDFTDILDYFLTQFGERDEFHALGHHARSDMLELLVKATAERMLGAPPDIKRLIFTRIPRYHFMHGGGMIGTKVVTCLYFEDIATGLLALASFPGGGTIMARFSGVPMKSTEVH